MGTVGNSDANRRTATCAKLRALPLFVSACLAPVACRSEPRLPPAAVAQAETAAPRLEKRTKHDRKTGHLVREWSVLVYSDRPPQKHGAERVFYSSGAKQWSREFDHGKPKGAWRSWYEDGQPRSECFFADPSVDTVMTWWYPGGRIQSRGPARNGAHRGVWRFYYKNGQLAEEGPFVDNQRHGEWRAWSEDGQVATLRKYAKGVRVSEKPAPEAPFGPAPPPPGAPSSTVPAAATLSPKPNASPPPPEDAAGERPPN
jgi:hypothetical protein